METRESYTIKHREDFETTGRWALARRSLGLKSFGMNLVDIEPGGKIPEHDEIERDQEEVFVLLSGAAVLVVDGQEFPLRAGTFARLDPPQVRTVVNKGDEVATLLIVSAPTTSGYAPAAWS